MTGVGPNAGDLEQVLGAARRGANSVSSRDEVVATATERALDHFVDAFVSGQNIPDPAGWAFKIGRQEAMALARTDTAEAPVAGIGSTGIRLPSPAEYRERLQGDPGALTLKMLEAVRAYIEAGTQHGAARTLGVDRSNLRRMLRRAWRRLQSGQEHREAPSAPSPLDPGSAPLG